MTDPIFPGGVFNSTPYSTLSQEEQDWGNSFDFDGKISIPNENSNQGSALQQPDLDPSIPNKEKIISPKNLDYFLKNNQFDTALMIYKQSDVAEQIQIIEKIEEWLEKSLKVVESLEDSPQKLSALAGIEQARQKWLNLNKLH